MTTTRNITVRKARDEDYEGVLNITKNFNMGADYIQFSYHELINDPDLSYYVCEVDGEVAIAAYEPLDIIVKLPTLSDNAIPEIQELDTEDLAVIFQNKELVNYLFPDGFIAMISWFFEPLLSNIHHIKKQSPHISISAALSETIKKLKSFSNVGESNEKPLSGVDGDNSAGRQGLLLVSTYYCNPDLIFFAFDIYGEPRQGKEEEDLKHFLLHGLQYAISVIKREDIKSPLVLGLSTKEVSALNVWKTVLASLGFEHGMYETLNKHFFFEQDFEKLLSE